MWRKVGQFCLVVVIWGAIATYVILSWQLVRRHKEHQMVNRVEVEIIDSCHMGQLITTKRVLDMLLEQGIATINTRADQVKTKQIKELICSEGFVDDVDIYSSYSGTLHIGISQRVPILRYMASGYNSYITADGYIFRSPERAALFVPVVSGNYRPLFTPDYQGDIKAVLSDCRNRSLDTIATIGSRAVAVHERIATLNESREQVRDTTARGSAERERLMAWIEGHLRDCNRALEHIANQQQAVRDRYRVVERRYGDFVNLIGFVEHIYTDRFWRSEIVQVEVRETEAGELWLTLVPRSGNHIIEMGHIVDVELKLKRLKLFYDKVAATSGWESYKSVNLNFADRIVCTYNEKEKDNNI